MTAVLEATKQGRDLVSPELFGRLADRIVKDKGTDRELAERITDQALAFLGACAVHGRGAALVPSAAVDIGWHMFILHTRDYAAFCEDVAGFFIHHVPTDDTGEPAGDPVGVLDRTVSAIQEAGYLVDPELWGPSAKCGPCHEEGNCAASGKDGNENKDNRKHDD